MMSLDRFNPGETAVGVALFKGQDLVQDMEARAETAAGFLKALSHEGRLMILCYLAEGERSVTELEGLLGQRQAAVSQQLARLRLEGLVATRREGKAIIYRLADPRVSAMLEVLPSVLAAR
jgi:DNA-binding transcriptional ArsR family regulator